VIVVVIVVGFAWALFVGFALQPRYHRPVNRR